MVAPIPGRFAGPLKFLHGVYNCPEANLQEAWDAGFRFISYDQYGYNGDTLIAADSWDAARKNLRDKNGNVVALPVFLVPGLKANNSGPPVGPSYRDRTSMILRALLDATVLGFATDDEPGTCDQHLDNSWTGPLGPRQVADASVGPGPNMVGFRAAIQAVADAHGLPIKPVWCNDGPLTYMNKTHTQTMDCVAIDYYGCDYYPISIGQTVLAGSRADGHEFTATQAGMSAWYATKQPVNPITGKPIRTLGGHYIAFGQMGSLAHNADGSYGPKPTLAQQYVLSWDPIFNGAGALCEFVTCVEPFEGWNYDEGYTPWNTEFQQWIDILEARGHLMSKDGGRTASDVRHSPLADTGSGSIMVPDLYTGPWLPITDGSKQIQGGFTTVRMYSDDKADWTDLILNMTGVDAVLNDTVPGGTGITGMAFPADKPIKAFARDDAAFAHNLFDPVVSAPHLGLIIGPIIDLAPDCTYALVGTPIDGGPIETHPITGPATA